MASNIIDAAATNILSTSISCPSALRMVPPNLDTILLLAPAFCNACCMVITCDRSNPSAERIAMRRLFTESLTVFSILRAGDRRPWFLAMSSVGSGTPIPFAIRLASSWSTRLNKSTIRCRISLCSTLPNSKWAADTRWSCWGSDRLFQNRVAWLKWSWKLSLRFRILCPSTFSA